MYISPLIAMSSCQRLHRLVSQGVVHGDVAARNFLVDFNNNCCVCDFGMSQILPQGRNSFSLFSQLCYSLFVCCGVVVGQSSVQTSGDTKLPIAWAAPETLLKHEWSFETVCGCLVFHLNGVETHRDDAMT